MTFETSVRINQLRRSSKATLYMISPSRYICTHAEDLHNYMCGGAASSGETDAAVLPSWCGHCRERSLFHRTLKRDQTPWPILVYSDGLTGRMRGRPLLLALVPPLLSITVIVNVQPKTPNTDNKFSSKLEVVTLVALEDCAEKRSPRCDVATVPVAMATESDAPRSYWSGSQPGSSPSHSNVRTPLHADTEVVSIRL
ncbi:hypothetical protein J6590_092384 [Homalodisca vitripennis]|nr:hypothetical protein J6590_092384 [Homalodisca vitripennis]